MKQWTEQVLKNSQRLAIPIMTHPGIELIGKSVKEAVTNGEVHFEAISKLNEIYPSAACTVIMDLTVEAEAFGANVIFPEDEIPSVTQRLVYDRKSVLNLTIPDLTTARIPQYLLANRLTAHHITDKPIFAGCIGPYSLAGRLYDMSEFMMACYCEPETAKKLLEKCTEFLINYCVALKEQGVDGVVIAEPAAGLLSGEGCLEFSSNYIQQIVEKVQDDNFMIILHNCGNRGQCTEAMINSKAAALHFGNVINMEETLAQCPSNILIMGNLDPVGLFKDATPETVERVTLDLLNKTSRNHNFILSSGCDIPPHTPHENIRAFYEALAKFNSQK